MPDTGAAARIYMGTAAVPAVTGNTANRTGVATRGGLPEVVDTFRSVGIDTTQGTVDITKLGVDRYNFFRSFIAGLRGASGSAPFGDDAAGTFIRRLEAITAGILHARGRGKVDMIVRPQGDGAGKIQIFMTIIVTGFGATTEVETEFGSDMPFTVDGQPIWEVQTA